MWAHTREKATGEIVATPQLALPVNVEETGEVRLYRLTLPFLPPSKNVYDGWQTMWQASAKKKWVKRIAEECEAHMMPKGVRHIGLAATLVFASKNRRDPSNYSSTLWNFVPDALQYAGVLQDDRDGRVEFGQNLGVKFAYDTRTAVPKIHRQRTILAITMRVGDGHGE